MTARIIAFPMQPRIAAATRAAEIERALGMPPLSDAERALLDKARAAIAQLPPRK